LVLTDIVNNNTDIIEIGKNAEVILNKRYLKKDETGKVIETIPEMFFRVASTIAKNKEDISTYYKLMTSGRFLPNSPTLMNAGISGTLSACFVLSIEDSMNSILDTSKVAGMIMKYGGGVGYSFSNLRAKGTKIKSTHGKACGPVAVLKHYDSLSKMITQGGKRSGANMGVLHIDHPDVREFIHVKDADKQLTDFNISIIVTDDFMKAVTLGDRNAVKLFNELSKSAWETGDPGIIFIDEVNRKNKTPHLGLLEATNPCGEVPLYSNEACNLGSINLTKFVDIPSIWDSNITFQQKCKLVNIEALEETVKSSIRFLDDVIDENKFPTEDINDAVNKTRKIGLGVMGWADLLVLLEIPYASNEALMLAKLIANTIKEAANTESLALAIERGVYPGRDSQYDEAYRNATRTCIAPTGTISRIAGVSSGIEPLFSLVYTSKVLNGETLYDVAESFIQLSSRYQFLTAGIMKQLEEGLPIADIAEIPDRLKKVLQTALEIDYNWHVKHQEVWQKYTDLAISKTINMSEKTNIADVKDAFIQAWKSKCKGITIYRNNSRQNTVLSVGKVVKEIVPKKFDNNLPVVNGKRYKLKTAEHSININVTEFNGKPVEVFINVGKSGSEIQASMEAIGRLCSVALQNNISVEEVYNQLRGISSGLIAFGNGEKPILSYADGIARVLKHYINNENTKMLSGLECPECGDRLITEEGCLKCGNIECSYSRC